MNEKHVIEDPEEARQWGGEEFAKIALTAAVFAVVIALPVFSFGFPLLAGWAAIAGGAIGAAKGVVDVTKDKKDEVSVARIVDEVEDKPLSDAPKLSPAKAEALEIEAITATENPYKTDNYWQDRKNREVPSSVSKS